MDPALAQLLAQGDPADEVEIILKLREEGFVPPAVRIVARFGDIVTCRIPRGQVREVWGSDAVLSAKAPRLLAEEPRSDTVGSTAPTEAVGQHAAATRETRHVPSAGATGRNVVVATVDWGIDFAHPNFRRSDGSTRLLAMWDQGTRSPTKPPPEPYGYGVVHTREEIDAALRSSRPYETLGYHPADADAAGDGAHGTHVADIAAGSGLARGSVPGVAPEADLLFVHLAAGETGGLATLGDTARILEAMEFIARTCGSRPWVANMSVGRCGGPHTGLTLVENGLDNLLREAPGRAVVQSAGNYYDARVHAAGRLRPGEDRTLHWMVSPADITPNECEIFYSGRDTFAIEIRSPGVPRPVIVNLGESRPVVVDGRTVGHAYHRAFDPGRGDHHVDIFLDAGAPGGTWEIGLIGRDILDGRFDAWVERDATCPNCQSRFDARDAVPTTTTGTIANGFRTIAVGAYDARLPGGPLAPFSSSGLTRDGREKPNLVAPGVEIEAARSAGRDAAAPDGLLTRKSGTSMAAPFVTGTIACMFEAAGRPLWVHETRRLLMGSARGINAPPDVAARIGSGYLDTARAIAAARELVIESPRAPERRAATTGGFMRTETYHGGAVTGSGEVWAGRAATEGEAFRMPSRDDAGEVGDACGVAHDSAIAPQRRTAENASLFDALSGYRAMPRSNRFSSMFEVVGAPRQPLRDAVRPGDIVVRRALGEGALAHSGIVASGEMVPREVAYRSGWIAERSAPGLYGVLMEEESYGAVRPSVARRLLDERGIVPYDQIILRPRIATGIELGEVARGGIMSVAADRHGNGFAVTQVRPEFAGAYQRMYDQVHALGGIVTSAGGLRALEPAVPGGAWQPGAGRSSTSLHYTGRAIDLSTESGMQRADNPYAITLERELPDGRPLWHVYCVSTDPHPDSPLYDAALIHEGVLECLIWVRNQPPRSIRREGRFFSLTEVMRRNGWSRIPARSNWRSEYMAVEWWHFQFEEGLVNGVTTFGQEVGRVWTRDELAGSTLTPFLHYVWRNGAFVAPAAGGAAATVAATERVRWVQVILNAVSGERLGVDGDLGPQTREALRRFQEREQLAATGALDERTEVALVQRGLEAIAMQSMFGGIGTVDARTVDEVRRFQTAQGLTVDGLVGPAVRAAMVATLAARSPQEMVLESILR